MSKDLQSQAQEVVSSCLAYRARKLARVATRIYNDHLGAVGLNVAEMNLLAAIGAQGTVRPSQLGGAMKLEKSTLSRNLRRLEARDCVAFRDNPEDRGELVSLTDHGAALLREALPAWERAQHDAQTALRHLRFEIGEVEL